MGSRERQGRTVLILSTDAVIAALLSILSELEGYTPEFAAAGEPVPASIARIKPSVVLLDCDHAEGCADESLAAARQADSRVIVFSPGRVAEDVQRFAEQHGLAWLALPVDRAALGRVLRDGLASLVPFAMLAVLAP